MSYSENNTYEQILERTLSNPNFTEIDKRPGSIIFDSLAPVCMELADAYVKMDILEEQTNLMTATGENLDKKCFDYGVKRFLATKAKRIASFKKNKLDAEGNPEKDEFGKDVLIDMDVPIGSKFSVPSNDKTITYTYIGLIDGYKIVECDQFGTIGNSHSGIILPLSSISNLAVAKITGTYQPASDEELDSTLRQRAQDTINYKAFGGNIPDYIEHVKDIDGAGNCKVFPAWEFNGSVLLSVVDSQYNPASTEFCALIKKQLDPEELTGEGRGIAPIGHFVTVTAPVKQYVDIEMSVKLESDITIGTVKEAIKAEIEKYFNAERHRFKQNINLAIYRARIIDCVMNVPEVVNVYSVKLNGRSDADIEYIDENKLGKQYLPYLREVTIG